MKYCKKCRRIASDDEKGRICSHMLSDNFEKESPCELICTDEASALSVSSSLSAEKIPFSDVLTDKVQMVWGNVSGKHVFYVPFCFLKKAYDTLATAGLSELPDYYDELEYGADDDWHEMSPRKRNIVRVLSIIAFAVIVYICAAGVDAAALFIKGLFG